MVHLPSSESASNFSKNTIPSYLTFQAIIHFLFTMLHYQEIHYFVHNIPRLYSLLNCKLNLMKTLIKMDPKLSEIVSSGDTTAFHSLLAEDPHVLDRVSLMSAQNPLHIATFTKQNELVREILSRKPGFALELNENGFSPIHIASANGDVEIVREILKVGSDVCLVKGRDAKTPLHCAAMKGRVGVIKELVSASPNSVKEVTTCGETAIHLAVKNNQSEAVKVLVEEIKRVDMVDIINWKDNSGNTILHLATFRKQHEIIRLLIGEDAIISGVDVNAVNSNGLTPKDVLDFTFQSGESDCNDIHLYKLFQQSAAMSSQDVKAINPVSNLVLQRNSKRKKPAKPASFTWNLWRELMKEVEDSSTDTQNALMVVAVLIATVTYQAILSPPSGFVSADTRKSPTVNTLQRREALPGEATMSTDPEVFIIFTIFNAIGFFASLAMISLLTTGFPLRAGLRLAILSMTATYVIAAFYMAPTTIKTVIIVVGFMGLLVLAEFVRFMVWLLRKWGVPVRKLIIRSHPDDIHPQV